jgi:hypothetical protein
VHNVDFLGDRSINAVVALSVPRVLVLHRVDGVIAEGANADAAVAVDRLQRHLLHGLVGKLGPLFTLRQARAEQVTPHWLVVLGPQGLDEFIVGNRALKVLFGLVHVCSIQSSAFSFSTEK